MSDFIFPVDFILLKNYIMEANNLKAIHNKDYSVVKTFRAARKRRPLSFFHLEFSSQDKDDRVQCPFRPDAFLQNFLAAFVTVIPVAPVAGNRSHQHTVPLFV